MAGKVSALTSRTLGRGGGTALPGLVAFRLHPSIVRELAAQLPMGSVVVTGTNGKTTTCRLLGAIAGAAGCAPLRNESGSNLSRGLASTFVQAARASGNLPANAHTIGLFEVDEAALPEVVTDLHPRVVVLLDLFRDQLDRYGEVATVARRWSSSLAGLPSTTTIIANADDPLITALVRELPNVVYFGLEGPGGEPAPEHSSDAKACPICGGSIEYSERYLGHLGHYRCAQCGFSRPRPSVSAHGIHTEGLAGSSFTLQAGSLNLSLTLPLPGTYNVYNAVAACASAVSIEIPPATFSAALSSVTPAFGRMEHFHTEGRTVYLALAKNPTGLNEVMRAICQSATNPTLLMLLNDNTADGRDVSWIWDADIELLAGHIGPVLFGGTRAEDMALRFKYAGIRNDCPVPWPVEHDYGPAFDAALRSVPGDGTLFVVPTYTAMLGFRDMLVERRMLPPYWEV